MGVFYALLAIICTGLATIGGVLFVRSTIAKDRDKERVAYQLFFPTDLPSDTVLAYFRELGTMLSSRRIEGTRTMAFEVMLDGGQIEWIVHIPWQLKEVAVNKLRTLVPGSSAVKLERQHINWSRVVEVSEKRRDAPLYIPDVRKAVESILSHNNLVQDGEKLMIQIVIGSAGLREVTESKSVELPWWLAAFHTKESPKHHKEKLSEPNVNAVIRVASRAKTPARSKKLISDVATSFRPLARQPNGWTFRDIPQQTLIRQFQEAASTLRWTARLNASELLAVVAWPVDSPDVSGLPRGTSRQLPPNPSVPKDQMIIGHSNYAGKERKVGLTHIGGMQHTHIIGGTGSGKSTLMANMAEQDMLAGHTVIAMEPKGDLYRYILERVPRERIKDVVIVDVNDTDYPVGFNVLQQGNPRVAAGKLKTLFEYLYPDIKNSIYARSALHRGLETLILDPTSSFVDLAPLFSPSARTDAEDRWRDGLIRRVTDPDVARFWSQFNALRKEEQERYAQPLMNRVWVINETPEVRNIFGQSTSSFSFEDVFLNNKILLINLAGVPDDVASLTGTMFMQAMWTAIQRVEGQEKQRAYLYLDEFQSFLKLPIGASEMLAKSRSFGLGMRLAHQHLDQLKSMSELSSAVMNNARNKIVYQTSAADGTVMAREFGSNALSVNDFQNLRQYEAYSRVVTDEGVSQPFSMRALPPSKPTADVSYIRRLSRERYGRERLQVISDMQERRQIAEEATGRRSRPKISGEDWN